MVRSEEGATLVERGTQQRIRSVELAKLLVDASQRLVQLGLHRRLPIEALGVLYAPVDERHDVQTVGGPDRLVATLEEVQHEMLDALGTTCLGDRRVSRRQQPQRVENDQTDDDGEVGNT